MANLQIVQSLQRMACTKCGAEANAACNCGEAYEILAGAREATRQRVKAHREREAERNQRPRNVTGGPPKVTIDHGNGKTTVLDMSDGDVERATVNEFHRKVMNFFTAYDAELRAWTEKHKLDPEAKASLMQAIYLAADGLTKLAQALDGR